ncbi:MAG: ABC transporter ATP-binding protein, partial [Gemmatimonadetes bacterium]|nr:ABC transporter ATP-binding protein [Gemmatimonadota bacterium]
MGFVMDGLEAEDYDRTYGDRQLVGRIARYFAGQGPTMALVTAVIVANALLDVALPVALARGVDGLDAASRGLSGRAVAVLVGAILVAGALSWVCNYLRQWRTARAVGDVVLRLRVDAFDAVLARDLSFYDEHPSGKIVSRVTSDTEDFATVVTLTLSLLSQGLLVVLMAGLLLARNWRLALLALAIAPLIVAVALGFRALARTAIRRSQRSLARVNANVQEAIAGITVAKTFRRERAMYDEFRGVNAQAYHVSLRTGLVFSALFPVLLVVAGLGTTVVVYFGGRWVLAGAVSAGEWYLFVLSIGVFWFPLTSIASFWSQFQQGLGASERVFALVDASPRVVQTGREPVGRLRGRIEFRGVTFAYGAQEQVLERFDLAIEAGETLALVGHTGAGKSTLGKLVARFYEYQGGALLVDGRDIRTLDLGEYRRQLGVVPQTPFLFTGTIAENVRYARPEASDEEVAAVARRIGGGDWLEALPDGLATEVGEGGRGLSLGQRQLVALARVLLQ